MELHFTPEQEAHLVQIAQHEGKNPEQLVFDVALHLLGDDLLFSEAVQRGLDQADAGNFIEEGDMDKRFREDDSRLDATTLMSRMQRF